MSDSSDNRLSFLNGLAEKHLTPLLFSAQTRTRTKANIYNSTDAHAYTISMLLWSLRPWAQLGQMGFVFTEVIPYVRSFY